MISFPRIICEKNETLRSFNNSFSELDALWLTFIICFPILFACLFALSMNSVKDNKSEILLNGGAFVSQWCEMYRSATFFSVAQLDYHPNDEDINECEFHVGGIKIKYEISSKHFRLILCTQMKL